MGSSTPRVARSHSRRRTSNGKRFPPGGSHIATAPSRIHTSPPSTRRSNRPPKNAPAIVAYAASSGNSQRSTGSRTNARVSVATTPPRSPGTARRGFMTGVPALVRRGRRENRAPLYLFVPNLGHVEGLDVGAQFREGLVE